MPGKMVSIPSIERGCDVYSSIHKGRVKSNGERKVAQRNLAKGERQHEGIERARTEAGNDKRNHQQTVAMDKRKKDGNDGKHSRSKQQNEARPQQPSDVDSKRADEHERCIVGTVKPGAVVVAYANVAL